MNDIHSLPKFLGVLKTTKRKHLLINCRLRRTACRRVLYSGTLHEGLDQWNGDAPIQCPKCAEEWKKMQAEVV